METKLHQKNILEVKQYALRKDKFNSYKGYDFDKRKNNFSTQEKIRIVIEGQSGDMSIRKLCSKEGIIQSVFNQWTQEFINSGDHESISKSFSEKKLSEVDKYSIVLEGKSGMTSIAEICRRETITQDTFLKWNQNFSKLRKSNQEDYIKKNSFYNYNVELIKDNTCSYDTLSYIENFIDLTKEESFILLESNYLQLEKISFAENIVCNQKLNNIRYINKYLAQVNSKLKEGGIFVGCFETLQSSKKRKFERNNSIISNLLFFLELLVKNFLLNTSFIRNYYLNFTKGKNRLLSKAEGLGRLVNSGYKIMDYKSIDGLLYFVVKKIKETKETNLDINSNEYNFIYRTPRIGKNGKIIYIYKFRTMYPYSEFIQDYVLNANGYAKSGKPAEDFRIPNWGKVMRKYWMDELPQILNLLKGEIKLVGARPVSERYFRDIPKEMQKLRLTQKPGCIPPYISLNKETSLISILQSEMNYLEDKEEKPYTTDIRYFFKAIYNILIKKRRSA